MEREEERAERHGGEVKEGQNGVHQRTNMDFSHFVSFTCSDLYRMCTEQTVTDRYTPTLYTHTHTSVYSPLTK